MGEGKFAAARDGTDAQGSRLLAGMGRVGGERGSRGGDERGEYVNWASWRGSTGVASGVRSFARIPAWPEVRANPGVFHGVFQGRAGFPELVGRGDRYAMTSLKKS
ncbi:hypothetical protein GCM10020221_09210 [Streptomyces thioluteus]|uniref:Uncharacterized protein n=1 Tax=Streptomyces thioluteus TaxID=66431 RepID=A0ABN3WGU3_STRTU